MHIAPKNRFDDIACTLLQEHKSERRVHSTDFTHDIWLFLAVYADIINKIVELLTTCLEVRFDITESLIDDNLNISYRNLFR